MISYKKKFLFIHIPKTAGTSLEMALEDDSCIFKRNQWSRERRGFNAPLNHLTLNQLSACTELSALNLDSFFKFTFVRNPWDKVVSECFCPHVQTVFKDCKTMGEKIRKSCHLANQGGYGGHFLKQHAFIKHPVLKMDFIGRFENLKEDTYFLFNSLRLPVLKLKHTHQSQRKNYREYFNEETATLVYNTYTEDITKYNYSFNE